MRWVPLLSITALPPAECVCIAVSHPSRLYVTQDGIITHNTTTGPVEQVAAPAIIQSRPVDAQYQKILELKGVIPLGNGAFQVPQKLWTPARRAAIAVPRDQMSARYRVSTKGEMSGVFGTADSGDTVIYDESVRGSRAPRTATAPAVPPLDSQTDSVTDSMSVENLAQPATSFSEELRASGRNPDKIPSEVLPVMERARRGDVAAFKALTPAQKKGVVATVVRAQDGPAADALGIDRAEVGNADAYSFARPEVDRPALTPEAVGVRVQARALGPQVGIVNDSSLPWEGRLTPDGRVELNAAMLTSPEDVDRVLDHEVAHAAERDPETAETFAAMRAAMPADFISEMEADLTSRGYGTNALSSEVAANLAQMLNRQFRDQPAWKRLLQRIKVWGKQRFGMTLSEKDAQVLAARLIARGTQAVRQQAMAGEERFSLQQTAIEKKISKASAKAVAKVAAVLTMDFPADVQFPSRARPQNPERGSMLTPPRLNILNHPFVMPAGVKFSTLDQFIQRINREVGRMANFAFREPDKAAGSLGFYSGMGNAGYELAGGALAKADLYERWFAYLSPRSSVISNAAKAIGGGVSAITSGFTPGLKAGTFKQIFGMDKIQEGWTNDESFGMNIRGVENKVRNFYLNGAAELLERALIENAPEAQIIELGKKLAASLETSSRTQGGVVVKFNKLSDVPKLRTELQRLVTSDMWDQASLGNVRAGFILESKDSDYRWVVPGAGEVVALTSAKGQKVLEWHAQYGENAKKKAAKADETAEETDDEDAGGTGVESWSDLTWQELESLDYDGKAGTIRVFQEKDDGESYLAAGGESPLYDVSQAISGVIADTINAMGGLAGKKRWTAYNVQEFRWGMEKTANPKKGNRDFSSYDEVVNGIKDLARYLENGQARLDIKAAMDRGEMPKMSQEKLDGLDSSVDPTLLRSLMEKLDRPTRYVGSLGASEYSYAQQARQLIPFELQSEDGGALYKDIVNEALLRVNGNGRLLLDRMVSPGFVKGLQDVVQAAGLPVMIRTAETGTGSYRATMSPQITLEVSGPRWATKLLNQSIGLALEQTGANLIRNPTLAEVTAGVKQTDVLQIAIPEDSTDAQIATLMQDLGQLQDSQGRSSDKFIGGHTSIRDAGGRRVVAIHGGFYDGDFGLELNKVWDKITKQVDLIFGNEGEANLAQRIVETYGHDPKAKYAPTNESAGESADVRRNEQEGEPGPAVDADSIGRKAEQGIRTYVLGRVADAIAAERPASDRGVGKDTQNVLADYARHIDAFFAVKSGRATVVAPATVSATGFSNPTKGLVDLSARAIGEGLENPEILGVASMLWDLAQRIQRKGIGDVQIRSEMSPEEMMAVNTGLVNRVAFKSDRKVAEDTKKNAAKEAAKPRPTPELPAYMRSPEPPLAGGGVLVQKKKKPTTPELLVTPKMPDAGVGVMAPKTPLPGKGVLLHGGGEFTVPAGFAAVPFDNGSVLLLNKDRAQADYGDQWKQKAVEAQRKKGVIKVYLETLAPGGNNYGYAVTTTEDGQVSRAEVISEEVGRRLLGEDASQTDTAGSDSTQLSLPKDQSAAGQSTAAVQARLDQRSAGPVNVVNDPALPWEGRLNPDGTIELNAARLPTQEDVDRVLDHEIAHLAERDPGTASDFADLRAAMPADFVSEMEADLTGRGYGAEALPFEVAANLAQMMNRQFQNLPAWKRALQRIKTWAKQKLGMTLTDKDAQAIAARLIARGMKAFRKQNGKPGGKGQLSMPRNYQQRIAKLQEQIDSKYQTSQLEGVEDLEAELETLLEESDTELSGLDDTNDGVDNEDGLRSDPSAQLLQFRMDWDAGRINYDGRFGDFILEQGFLANERIQPGITADQIEAAADDALATYKRRRGRAQAQYSLPQRAQTQRLASITDEIQEGWNLTKANQDERTIDGTPVEPVAYRVRNNAELTQQAHRWLDGFREQFSDTPTAELGPLLTDALKNNKDPMTGKAISDDVATVILVTLGDRLPDFGLTRGQWDAARQHLASRAGFSLQFQKVYDPLGEMIDRGRKQTGKGYGNVTGGDLDADYAEMQQKVIAAQAEAIKDLGMEVASISTLFDDAVTKQEQVDEAALTAAVEAAAALKRKLAKAKKELDATKAETAAEIASISTLYDDAVAKQTDLEAKARKAGEQAGARKGRNEAVKTFRDWLKGKKIDELPPFLTMARRYLNVSRFDADQFSTAMGKLFPTIPAAEFDAAAAKIVEMIENKAAAARRREITAFIDGLAGRKKAKPHGERLGKFLGSLMKAEKYGVLDQDTFLAAFAHAFNLNGLTAANTAQLRDLWHSIQSKDANGNPTYFGMVRETLERQFATAVNAIAPAARWDNLIFDQYQSGILSSVGSIVNQFSGVFRVFTGLDAVQKAVSRRDVGAFLSEWWKGSTDVLKNLPLMLTAIRGDSLGHLPPQVRGGFTPSEQKLQLAGAGQTMRVELPNGKVVSMGDNTRKVARAKELFAWRLIRGAEGVSGITDAAAHYRTALAAYYRNAGMKPGAARMQATADLVASPADRTAAVAQATQEQAGGLIGKGAAALKRRTQEIIQNGIDVRLGVDLTKRVEMLTSYQQFKTEPLGPIGSIISRGMALASSREGAGRVGRFFFLFGRFLGHSIDITLAYTPGVHLLTLSGDGTSRRQKAIQEVFGSVAEYNQNQHAKAAAGGAFLLATGILLAMAQAMADDDEEPFFSVTGSAPMADRGAQEKLIASGKWQPGVMKIFGKAINYQQIPELAPLLTLLGNTSDYALHGETLYPEKGKAVIPQGTALFANTADVIFAPIKRSTYRQWLEAMTAAIKTQGGGAAKAYEAFSNLATAPVGGFMRVPLLVDADKLARADVAKDAEGFAENLMRRIPFVHVGETMINAYGEVQPGFGLIALVPHQKKASPDVMAAARLNVDTNTSRQFPQDPELEAADGTVIEVTRGMREQFVTESGRLYVESLLNNEEAIRRAFEQGGAGAAQKIVSNISTKANKEAKAGLAK